MSPARRGDILLLAATAVWGLSFVAVKASLRDLSPMAFLAARFTVGMVLLAPLARRVSRRTILAGVLLGALMGGGFAAQTVGLVYTSPSRSAFLTGLASVLVPFIAWAIWRHRLHAREVGAVLIAGVGIYFLTGPDAGGLNRGDLWTLVCAVLFGTQIVAAAELSRRHDIRMLVLLEVVVTGAGATAFAGCCETVRWTLTGTVIVALLFTGVLATAGACWAQLAAQRLISPTRAALILALEPVFASIAAWLLLGETLSATQWAGGSMILAGMLAADWPARARAATPIPRPAPPPEP